MKKVTESKPVTIDFRKIVTSDLEGKELNFDISKSFANHVYQTTGDLGMLEVAQTIYKTGEIELTEVKQGLIEVVNSPQFPFLAIVKKRLLEMIEGR